METEKCLVLSTSHITEEDDRWMRNKQTKEFLDFGYGWIIPSVQTTDAPFEAIGIREVLVFAQDNDFHMIKIDRDGPIVKGLPVYDW